MKRKENQFVFFKSKFKLNQIKFGKTIAGGFATFGSSTGFFFFVMGLFAYKDVDLALTLGLYAVIVEFLSILFLIPVLGFFLWYFATFTGNWGYELAKTLELPVVPALEFAWWFISISFLVGGIIITILLLSLIFKHSF